ncbi:hypothetical protein LG324_05250 [Phycicoccus jejuensis]|uniref:hypothetical protein n=1 Tax=Phycicoccus jejuensis TaxID=367299 RepID=UPI00384C55DC
MDQDALDVLRSAVERSKRHSTVQLPIDFVRDPSEGDTPLHQIGSDGRGQGLRLKLYLSMVMLATKEPRQLRPYPASAYATMLSIPDPAGQGARRVNQAQRWLRDAGFIQRVENGTHPPHVTILPLPELGDWGGRWITLPLDLWSNGWIHVMSGRALSIYVVLRELTGGRPDGSAADGRRKRQYCLSDETWARGAKDLQEIGLLRVMRIVDATDPFARRQPRLKYELTDDLMADLPGPARRRS